MPANMLMATVAMEASVFRCADAGESMLELAVEDDGCGLPADGVARGTGLGTRLIEAMARTHRAEVRYGATAPGMSGTRASIALPLRRGDRPNPG